MRIQVSARGCYFFCRLAGRGSTLPILRRILYEAGLANERENLAPNFLFTPLSALIMCRFCVRAVWVCAWQGLLFNFSERSPLKTCSLPTGVTWSGSKQTAIERTSDRTKQWKKREKSVRWKSSLSLEIIKEISSPTHTHTQARWVTEANLYRLLSLSRHYRFEMLLQYCPASGNTLRWGK